MDKISVTREVANDIFSANTEHESPHALSANEIRSLNDYEMEIVGGGDGVVCW